MEAIWCVRRPSAVLRPVAVAVMLGCGDGTAPGQPFRAVAEVRTGAEGCLVLATRDATYLPRNLPPEFAVVGRRVRFTAVRQPFFNTCNLNNGIELRHIEAAE
jgi:hypothetical protein